MNDQAKYSVRAYRSRADFETSYGYETEREAQNLKEAKKIAAYFLSATYRDVCEASECLGFAQVINRAGESIFETEARK